MKIFSEPESRLNALVSQYTAGKEAAVVSVVIEYNGKDYREIQFKKKNIMGKAGKDVRGILFIDGNDEVVKDRRLQKELSSAFFNLERLFEEGFISGLKRSIVAETDLKREEAEAEFVADVLEGLKEIDIEGAGRVKDIVLKLPGLKRENNQAITNFVELVGKYGGQSISYDDIICKLKPLYLETLMKNFEKVKVIYSGYQYYDNIRKEAMKNYKRRLVGVMGSNASREGMIIDSMLSHMIKVIEVYAEVTGLSNSEYIKYLSENERSMIDDMLDRNRIK